MKEDDERKVFAFCYMYDNLDVNLWKIRKKDVKLDTIKSSNSGGFILTKILNKRDRIDRIFDKFLFYFLFALF